MNKHQSAAAAGVAFERKLLTTIEDFSTVAAAEIQNGVTAYHACDVNEPENQAILAALVAEGLLARAARAEQALQRLKSSLRDFRMAVAAADIRSKRAGGGPGPAPSPSSSQG